MDNKWICRCIYLKCQKPFSQPSLFVFKEEKWVSTSNCLLVVVPFPECGLWKPRCWFRIPVSADLSIFSFLISPKHYESGILLPAGLTLPYLPLWHVLFYFGNISPGMLEYCCFVHILKTDSGSFPPLPYHSGCLGCVVTTDKLSKPSILIAVNL